MFYFLLFFFKIKIQNVEYQRERRDYVDKFNALTGQLLLLESRIKRKQKQIATVLSNRDLIIARQQKIIDALSSRLVDHGLDKSAVSGLTNNYGGDLSCTEFDSLNDSDSAVVLEDIDSDYNTSFNKSRRRSSGSGDVTVVRSISDAIETNLKYSTGRRSNCFLRRPEVLETVYSVEEDPESNPEVTEKRDRFKNRSVHIEDEQLDSSYSTLDSSTPVVIRKESPSPEHNGQKIQVVNFNRVMSNHRSVTKPKDVKYKRINKAKSKSLEELRGKLKHWVERGTNNTNDAGHHQNQMMHHQHNQTSHYVQHEVLQAANHSYV